MLSFLKKIFGKQKPSTPVVMPVQTPSPPKPAAQIHQAAGVGTTANPTSQAKAKATGAPATTASPPSKTRRQVVALEKQINELTAVVRKEPFEATNAKNALTQLLELSPPVARPLIDTFIKSKESARFKMALTLLDQEMAETHQSRVLDALLSRDRETQLLAAEAGKQLKDVTIFHNVAWSHTYSAETQLLAAEITMHTDLWTSLYYAVSYLEHDRDTVVSKAAERLTQLQAQLPNEKSSPSARQKDLIREELIYVRKKISSELLTLIETQLAN